jgi:hypothetical protein
MDNAVVEAMQQAGAGAFPAPGGMGQPGAPSSGQTPATPEADLLQSLVPTDDVEQGPHADEEGERALDDLGYGERPLQGPRGHSLQGFEHPLDRAAKQIRGELEGSAQRLAQSLFPEGPAGTNTMSRKALLDYVGRHWDDPADPDGSAQFRQTLLNRVAPKGPDGKRLPSGVKLYHKLYQDAIVATGKQRAAPEPPPPAPEAPPLAPLAPLAAPAPAPPAFTPPMWAGTAGPVAPNQLPPAPAGPPMPPVAPTPPPPAPGQPQL